MCIGAENAMTLATAVYKGNDGSHRDGIHTTSTVSLTSTCNDFQRVLFTMYDYQKSLSATIIQIAGRSR